MTDSRTVWKRPGAKYFLPQDEVHVWRARLDWPSEYIARLWQALSSDERERADRFYFPTDRTRHVIGRALSRLLLGHCLGITADKVRFQYGGRGKPSLATDLRQTSLNFNVSHSGDFVLVALAYRRNLGIDIERICANIEADGIANRVFSASERLSLAALPAGMRHDAFFACWTRKEAYVKGRGDGLSLAMDEFDVAFLPGQEPRLVETRHDPAEAGRWTLRDLEAGPNYRAALAVEGADRRLKSWDWLGELPPV
jgi:4'-phosphopantetheinyl transferase